MSTQRAVREYSGWSLIIDEQGIRRLYDELQSIVGSPPESGIHRSHVSSIRFNVQYSDKSAVENWSLDDLLSDENRTFRRIRTIEILASGSQHEISLKIGTKQKVKDQEQFVGTVLLDVSAPNRQRVFVVQSLIEDRIKSFRANRPASWVVLLSSIMLLLILVITLIVVLPPYLPKLLTEPDRLTGIQVKPIVVAATALVGILISISTTWLFPDLEFLLGQGIARHQRLGRLKSNLFWVVFVGTALSIIAGVVVSYLS